MRRLVLFVTRFQFLVWVVPFVLLCLSAFWNLGQAPLHDWDESRHGQNAIEMMRSGEWFHYTYDGKPDLWNAKPALGIWSIALSFWLFGLNEWALRLPSALAALATCGFVFLIMRAFLGKALAAPLLCLVILATSPGVFGFHTGRTGDLDALLVMGLMGAAYFWLQWERLGCVRFALGAGVLWGTAFLAKGVAAAMILPGLVLFSELNRSGQIQSTSRPDCRRLRPGDGLAAAVGLLFPAAWFVMQSLGARGSPAASVFEGHTQPWQVMIFYDVWKRLTQNIEGHGKGWELFFVFNQMDVYFSPWIYFFYVCVAVLVLVSFLKTRQGSLPSFGKIFTGGDGQLLLFALLCAAPLLVLLTFARSKLPWYVAPAIPFMAMGTAVLAKRVGDEISGRLGWHTYVQVWRLLLAAVVVAAVIRQSIKLSIQRDVHHQTTLEQLAGLASQNHPFCYATELRQSHRLALSFVGAEKSGWGHRPDLESHILGDFTPGSQGAQSAQGGSGASAEWRLGYKDLHQVAGCVLVWSQRTAEDET